ncbi:uncharacterized protein LOC113649844 [Tachysurus fulvidraco]|uniref:uncharacterized protein LOC113649844 n=1 Tax=Tachysurus fulvidraco TaxID=1234273 RepID=UPI001FED3801|nr:uncharacterized protein LOC113649844 [Tachysurus fulvidraco]XP_027013651.2 uncharacterized protein LOC113649844 [Tachysurus fulvidraco]
MSFVPEWIMENSKREILGQGCEILAATVGQFNPILEAVFKFSAMLFSNPESKEAKYLAEQFVKVNQKLENIQGDIQKTELAIKQSLMNIQYFNLQANINSQYEYFKHIFTPKSNKKLKRDEFLKFFEKFEGEKNLECLYNAIMIENTSGQTMLDIIVETEQRSRRAVEEFCASLKKLFGVGIISLMGYAALKEDTVDDKMGKKWLARMEDVEKRMKAAVDECVNNFAEQAKSDIDKMLKGKQSSVDPEFTKFLLEALVEKYYWVSWSVRVFNADDSKLVKFLFGKKHHINGGVDNYFENLSGNKIRVVVSFTADPKPLDKNQIKDQIEKEKGGVESVAESLSHSFPNCLVHAINRCTKVKEANNFQPEHLYYIHHKQAHICIHSE